MAAVDADIGGDVQHRDGVGIVVRDVGRGLLHILRGHILRAARRIVPHQQRQRGVKLAGGDNVGAQPLLAGEAVYALEAQRG